MAPSFTRFNTLAGVETVRPALDAFGAGAVADKPAVAFNVWCEVRPLRQDELATVGLGLHAKATHKVTCWYTPVITSTCSLLVNNVRLQVLAPPKHEAESPYMELTCGEVS